MLTLFNKTYFLFLIVLVVEVSIQCHYYKLVQGFRVTCLFTGQYKTKGYGTITDSIYSTIYTIPSSHSNISDYIVQAFLNYNNSEYYTF